MPEPNGRTARCPACHATESEPHWLEGHNTNFTLVRCAHCELVYTVPQLQPCEMTRYYEEIYYGINNVRFNRLFEWLIRWFRNRRARKIVRLHTPGRILDIGCGRGLILAYLRERGWESHGVELSEIAARNVMGIPGIHVTIGPFDPAQFEDGQFDVVMLWHVLEHIDDVSSAFDALNRIIKIGGTLVIAVPNISSWQARLTQYHWFHLDLPRHYSHFSEKWLTQALATRGFQLREVNHFSFEQNPYGWVQSLLNCCGFRKNLLYDVLKRGSARSIEHPIRQFPIQSILNLMAFAVLLPAVTVLQLLECAFRTGGTVEIYAVKRR